MSQPPPCRIVTDDVAIHWFSTYEDGVPCGCGTVTCTVERGEEEDSAALGYQIEDAAGDPGRQEGGR